MSCDYQLLLAAHLKQVAHERFLMLVGFESGGRPDAAPETAAAEAWLDEIDGAPAERDAAVDEVYQLLVDADGPCDRATYEGLGDALDAERKRRAEGGLPLRRNDHRFLLERAVERCELGLDLMVPPAESLADLSFLAHALGEGGPDVIETMEAWIVLGRASRYFGGVDEGLLLLGYAREIAVRQCLPHITVKAGIEASHLERQALRPDNALQWLIPAWRWSPQVAGEALQRELAFETARACIAAGALPAAKRSMELFERFKPVAGAYFEALVSWLHGLLWHAQGLKTGPNALAVAEGELASGLCDGPLRDYFLLRLRLDRLRMMVESPQEDQPDIAELIEEAPSLGAWCPPPVDAILASVAAAGVTIESIGSAIASLEAMGPYVYVR